MLRKMFGVALVGLVLCANAALADEIKGKMTKVDPKENKLTMKVDDKETEYTVAKDCKMPSYKSKDGVEKTSTLQSLHNMIEKGKGGVEATIVTTKKDDKDVVTEIKIAERKKKDKEK